jgi:hypothetical protein
MVCPAISSYSFGAAALMCSFYSQSRNTVFLIIGRSGFKNRVYLMGFFLAIKMKRKLEQKYAPALDNYDDVYTHNGG